MSNKSKKYYAKNNKKRLSPETKDRLKTGFLTLINNDACVKASREWKGVLNIIPIFFAIVAVILAILPSFVTQMNIQGSTAVYTAPVAGFDVGLASFTHALKYDADGNARAENQLVHVEIDDAGNLKTTNLNQIYAKLDGNEVKWFADIDTANTFPAFEVFFNAGFATEIDDETFFNRLAEGRNPETGIIRYYDTTGAEVKEPLASYVAFGKTSVVFRKDIASRGTSCVYDKLHNYDLLSLTPKAADGSDLAYGSYTYREKIAENWKVFINNAYEPLKISGAWQFTGIIAAIDAGMIILFAITLFIMTRGKRNPFRIVTYWETMKMSMFASLTPALLSLALGFWLTQWSYLIFMFTFGLRMMWMSMKSLRPAIK